MRRLTDNDLVKITGTVLNDYHVENVRVKRGNCTDSDHYGFVLCRNSSGHYVTWQFHLFEDETVSVYWGHYFMEKREAAIRDFNTRDMDLNTFKVTITETLKLTVDVEAEDQQQAEQVVSDNWKNGEYVLGSENFVEVEFEVVPATQ